MLHTYCPGSAKTVRHIILGSKNVIRCIAKREMCTKLKAQSSTILPTKDENEHSSSISSFKLENVVCRGRENERP